MTGARITSRQIKVLGIQDREDFHYNSPRSSRHVIDRRRYLPLERVYRPMAGAKLINPWPLKNADLVHAWKRVPLGPTPFVVGFGWNLPLTWEHSPRSFALIMDALLSSRCRRIVASSEAAASAMLHRHEKHDRHDELRAKTIVRLPNADIPAMEDWFDPASKPDPLRLVFVGDHFGRKGGCVAVRLAEMAHRAKLPIHVTIVSSLTCGVWTDPTRDGFFDSYLKLLDLPNVTLIKSLPEANKLGLVAKAHLMLMPSLGDTHDYMVVEGMARFTPAIVTATGAFPEFIDADSGVLLPVVTNCQGEWKYNGASGRAAAEFEEIFASTVDRLTEDAFAACVQLLEDPARLAALRQGARRKAEAKFDAKDASHFWDDVYTEALSQR